jgi:hypothetical protein
MKYPTRRYANPNEFKAYAIGKSVQDLARQLRRSERSITNWLSGNHKIPWYAPELLRLQQLENNLILQQMGIKKPLGIVNTSGQVVPFARKTMPTLPANTQITCVS